MMVKNLFFCELISHLFYKKVHHGTMINWVIGYRVGLERALDSREQVAGGCEG